MRDTVTRLPAVLWGIVAIGLILRLLGAWYGNLMFDESAHLALADTISLHPDRFHLVSRTLDHPLLSVYLLKLSGWLFGQSNFGLRILHVVLGCATLVVVFLIGRRVDSDRAGLWAAGLLAVDQFHASWSRFFMPEVPMLFFWSLTLLFLLRLTDQSTRSFVALGIALGLAYLAKETATLLIPIAWLFVWICRRDLLRDWRWYAAHGVMLLVIAPDLVWNAMHFSESYLHRNAEMLAQPFRIQFKSVSFYLGELIRFFIDHDALDVDYDQGNAYAVHWPAGLLYLAASAAMMGRVLLGRLRQRAEGAGAHEGLVLLSSAFLVPVVVFTLLPGAGRFDPFWWASSSLIGAIVATGILLRRMASASAAMRWVGLSLLLYLGVHYVPLALRPGTNHPRVTVEALAGDAVAGARAALDSGDVHAARMQVIYALNIGGATPDAYFELARIDFHEGNFPAARLALERTLALEPAHTGAAALLRDVLSEGR